MQTHYPKQTPAPYSRNTSTVSRNYIHSIGNTNTVPRKYLQHIKKMQTQYPENMTTAYKKMNTISRKHPRHIQEIQAQHPETISTILKIQT